MPFTLCRKASVAGWRRPRPASIKTAPPSDIQTRKSSALNKGRQGDLSEADESTTGPASLTLVDPDGNLVPIDQHV